jgi:hypothetical protein
LSEHAFLQGWFSHNGRDEAGYDDNQADSKSSKTLYPGAGLSRGERRRMRLLVLMDQDRAKKGASVH